MQQGNNNIQQQGFNNSQPGININNNIIQGINENMPSNGIPQGNNINNPFGNNSRNQIENPQNEDDQDEGENENEFYLYFEVNDNKEIFLNTEPTTPFKQILIELKKKYEWLNDMDVKGFKFNNSLIPLEANSIQSGLQKGAKIDIVF